MKNGNLTKLIFLAICAVLVCLLSACVLDETPPEEIYYSVTYAAEEGGRIEGNAEQRVKAGENAEEVTAVPDAGYDFVKWSDGLTTATRRDNEVAKSFSVTAEFEKQIIYDVQYTAGYGGRIEGKTEQSIKHGDDAEEVTAVPDEGYDFVKWSDGLTSATRQDENVTENISVTAEFDLIVRTYALNYKYIANGSMTKAISLTYGKLDETKFPTPTKQRYSFVGWFIDDLQVTDNSGSVIVGNELFDYNGEEIYAKWTTEPEFTYKILLVYVTEINGVFKETRGDRYITVNYKMSEVERQICHNFTVKVREKMNYMLDGLVYFQVDEYFTTRSVSEEYFMHGSADIDYSLPAHRIPEIKELDIFLKYQSFMTLLIMHDYEDGDPTKPSLLNKVAGSSGSKFGTVYFDSIVRQALIDGDPLESFTDLNYWRWDHPMHSPVETFIHELVHTMEVNIKDSDSVYPFHLFLAESHEDILKYGYFEVIKRYLMNEAVVNGVKVNSIPYEFWAGEMDLWVRWK